jgi:hypothetical protein
MGTMQDLTSSNDLMNEPKDAQPVDRVRRASELRPILRIGRVGQQQEMYGHLGGALPIRRSDVAVCQRSHG